MKYRYNKILFFSLIIFVSSCKTNPGQTQERSQDPIKFISVNEIECGAERTSLYYPLIDNKAIGLVCNHTSLIGNKHLADSLVRAGFRIKTIFSPEHGFRGEAEAGAEIIDGADSRTGAMIISLYGKKKKPLPADLQGIDIILFDIQDVGVRFYTYISTLSLVMEAAAGQGIPVIVLDRPNPNGFYTDGPLLDTNYRSFVGMHPVPVVYGMTIGEYALMINGECWIGQKQCKLTVIPLHGYDHHMIVQLYEKPSPNLPDWRSVYLYPSLCLFEGTFISVGRGTEFPFQMIGHPSNLSGSYIFTPLSIPGVADHPPYEGKPCYGQRLSGFADNFAENKKHFVLFWLISMKETFRDSTNFFNAYFDKLAGNNELRNDILEGLSEDEIRFKWEPGLAEFRQTRKKYLLYPE